MKKISAIIIILVVSGFYLLAAVKTFATYKEMRQYLGMLINEKKFVLAEEVLQVAVRQFPDHLLANSFNLAYVRMQLKKYKGAIKALSAAQKQGVFFNIWSLDQPLFGFHWQDVAHTQRDLADAFGQICAAYPINEKQVVIGGFSSGGFASLLMSLQKGLPISGFIVLCPEVPEGVSDEDIRQAVARGVRGTVLSTAMDNRLEKQRQLADRFRDLGLQYQFMVTPDIGHWYPENLDKLLDQAIAHIYNR